MKKRILIVGYGSIGKRHLRIVRSSLPDADIRVLRRQSSIEIPDLADGCFSSMSDALEYSPDIAVVANPAPFHVAVAQPLAGIGCHLLIEKPLADRPDDVPSLLDAAKASGAILQVGYNLRFLSSLVHFRDLVHAQYPGRILSVRCESGQYLPSWRPDSDYRDGVSARAELGGGVLLELSHELDYLRWIFGDIAWVNAWSGKQSDLEINVEDTVHIICGHISNEHCQTPVSSLNIDFIRHDTTRSCLAIGEKGSLRWQATNGVVDYLAAGASVWKPIYVDIPERDQSYFSQWKHFLRCAEQKDTPMVTGADGLATLNVLAAARKSIAQNGIRVNVLE